MKKILLVMALILSEPTLAGVIGFVPSVKHLGGAPSNELLNENNNMVFYETENNYRFIYFKNSFYEKSVGFGYRMDLFKNTKINISLNLGAIWGYRDCYTKKYFPKNKAKLFDKIKNQEKNMVCGVNILKELGLPYREYNSTNKTLHPLIVPEIIYKVSDEFSVHSFIFANAVGLGVSYSF